MPNTVTIDLLPDVCVCVWCVVERVCLCEMSKCQEKAQKMIERGPSRRENALNQLSLLDFIFLDPLLSGVTTIIIYTM